MAAEVKVLATKMPERGLKQNLRESEDILEGEEPGAGRGAILVQSDSYEDIAGFMGSVSLNGSQSDTPSRSPAKVGRRKGSAQREVTDRVNAVDVEDGDVSSQDGDLGPVDVNLCRTSTTSTLDDGKGSDGADDSSNSEAMDPVQLRDPSILRRQLSTMSGDGSQGEVESCTKDSWRQHKKHIFILSSAGKPIYTRYGDEVDQASINGVLQVLFMTYHHNEECRDSLMSINAGPHRFVFLFRDPLLLVSASKGGCESQHQLKHQLLYAYYQIIFMLTTKRIEAQFKMKQSYDLRRQLCDVDRYTDNLMTLCDTDPAFLLGAVRSLPFDGPVRDTVAQTMQQNCKGQNLVFAILFADNQLITIVRHRSYYLHPVELHLIFNFVSKSEAFKSSEVWVPVCLPKFNATSYLYAYISYLDEALNACLVMLSVNSEDFAQLSKARTEIQKRLITQRCLDCINEAVKRKTYSMRSVGIPEIRHFLYKSKSTSLCTSPDYDVPYTTEEEQERLLTLYRLVHHRTHSNSFTVPQLKMYFVRGESETCVGWTTSGFEVYVIFGPLVTKQDTITGINKLLRWIKKEEYKLFVMNSLTISSV